MFASIPMLVYGIKPYNIDIIIIISFTVIALYSGFFATLLWNDISDKEIDIIAHPKRPLPSGRITVKKMFIYAVSFSLLTFIFSFLISFLCLTIVGLAAIFVTFHNKYLKKIIKIPAYSELLTPIQWIVVPLFGFIAIWTGLPQNTEISINHSFFGYISFNVNDFQNMILFLLFTYFADGAHDLPEGIHDIDGDKKFGIRTYATSFGEKNAARISFSMLFISGLLGIIIFFRTILTQIFLIPFLILWIYALYNSYKFLELDKNKMKEFGKEFGNKTFRYFWLTYDLIFLDLFIQILFYHQI
jgi:geranylgeranylglycerol-phosphate geranylgeranyltransferase